MFSRETVFRASLELPPGRHRPGEVAVVETLSPRAFREILRALRRSGVRVRFTEKIVRQESVHVLSPRRRGVIPAGSLL